MSGVSTAKINSIKKIQYINLISKLFLFGFFSFGKEKDVENFQDSQRVDKKNCDKPPLMIGLGGSPQSHALPWNRPQKN
jgi:hypothetical protein